MTILIEACVDSLAGAIAAATAGVDRLELNLALQLQGLTPSAGLVQQVLAVADIPVIAMCRPRAGNFCYSHHEWKTMLADTDRLIELGVGGIAFGCLTDNRQIDHQRAKEMRQLASPVQLVFHKALDQLADPMAGALELADLGIDRLMTSGQCASSLDGADQIRRLNAAVGERIEVLPAGGVNSANAADIVRTTGVKQLHGSFSGGNPSDLDGVSDEIRRTIAVLSKLQKAD